jgi:hypothetical protein
MKPTRKVCVSMRDATPTVYDKKTGDHLDLSSLPDTVRQWLTWDRYVDIEIDMVTGEARVLKGDNT